MNIKSKLKSIINIDYKVIIIISLILHELQDDLIWFSFILMGIAAYPTNLGTLEQSQKIYDIAGQAYSKAFNIVATTGYKTGESLYPHNTFIASFITNMITISLYGIVALMLIWGFGNLYKKLKEKKNYVR